MYNNFSSKKTKKVISALLASALVVTSAPITANAATAKVVGIGKTFTIKKTTKVSGLSKAEKKIVKVTVNKKKRTVTVKGLKAGKATFKIGKKAYTVMVGATSITKKTVTTNMTAGETKTLSVNAVNGKGDTIQFTSSKKGVVKVNKASAKANAKNVASTTVTAVAAGTAKITAKSKFTGKSKTFTIKVEAAAPAATTAPAGTDAPEATTGTATTAPATSQDPAKTEDPNTTKAPNATDAPETVTGGTITVTGVVTGASVKVVSGTTVVAETTATDTTATLPNVAGGTYTLVVSAKGYDDATQLVTVNGDVNVAVNMVKGVLTVSGVTAMNGTKEVDINSEVYATTTLKIAFSTDVDSTTVNTANIYLTQNGVKQLATVTYDVTKKEATLTLTGAFVQNKEYVLNIANVKSTIGADVTPYTTKFTTSSKVSVIGAKYGKGAGTDAASYTAADTNLDGGNVDTATESMYVKFANEMDRNTLNTTNVKLYDATDNKYITVTPSLVTDGNDTKLDTLKIVPAAMNAAHKYVLTISSNVLDVAGNASTGYTATFYYNGVAPKITSTTPAHNANNVYGRLTPGNGNKAFSWSAQLSSTSEALDETTLTTANVYMKNTDTETTVATKIDYSAAAGFITLTPLEDLDENVTYTVTIKNVKDVNGLSLVANDGSDLGDDEFSFKTGDFTNPTIVSITPENAAENVSISSPIVIKFSEKMNNSDLSLGTNIILKDSSNGNATFSGFSSWIKKISADGKTLTLTPSEGNELLPNRTYTLTIPAKTIHDVATPGNAVIDKAEVVFTTANTATATVQSLKSGDFDDDGVNIVNGATDVTKFQYGYINFSSKLKDTTGVYDLPSLVKIERYVAETGKWVTVSTDATAGVDTFGVDLVNSDKTIKITAPSSWTNDNSTAIAENSYSNYFIEDTQFRITLPSTIKDSNDNAIEATTYTFTIGTKPVVKTDLSYPAAYADEVNYKNPYVAVVLNDTESKLQDTTLNADTVKIVKKADGTVADQYALAFTNAEKDKPTTVAINETGSGDTGVLVNDAACNNKTEIAVDAVDATTKISVGDVIGVGSAMAVVKAVTATKVTVDRPVTLDDNADLHVYAEADTTWTVDGAAANDNLKVGDIVEVANGIGSEKETAVITKVKSATEIELDRAVALANDATITVKTGVVYKLKNNTELEQNTEYQVIVSGVKDIAGNPVNDTKYTFKTNAEVKPLKVVSATVEDDATNVATNQKVEIVFNEALANIADGTIINATAMNGSSTTTRVSFQNADGVAVPGTYKLSDDKKTLTFLPNGYLATNTVYTVTVDNTAASSAGDLGTKDYTFSFKTAGSSAAAIESAVWFDVDGDKEVSDGDIVRLTFNTQSVKGCGINAADDFALGGTAGADLGSSGSFGVVESTAGDNYIDITLGSPGLSIVPGFTTIKVVNTGTGAATFTTDAVTITAAK